MAGPPNENLLADWMAGRFSGLLRNCGNEAAPGVDESPPNRDWSARPTTRDQARIEAFMAPRLHPHSRLLHVGLGNSQLAQRFCHEVASIEGITITRTEYDLALSLHIPRYTPRLMNKYSRDFAQMGGKFDFIIDNNPSTFACCRLHFARMMLAFKAGLAPGGMLLTDRLGLGHVADDSPGLERWSFSGEDWFAMAGALDLQASAHGEQVLAMAAA